MAKLKILLVTLVCFLAAAAAQAQSTNSFKLTIAPPDNQIMITETTNLLTVFISNLTATNTEVVQGDTNTTTNITITPIFTNVTVTASWDPGKTLNLLDTGAAPDAKAKDSIYSGNFIAPSTKVALNLPVTYTIKADDITATNDSGAYVPKPAKTNVTLIYRIYPRPVNDKFTNAFKILPAGGTFTTYSAFDPTNNLAITNNYASMEKGEPIHGGGAVADASVWWWWSSPTATRVLIDLAGTSFKPVLSVYTGTAISNLVSVASATSTTLPAFVLFNAEAGKTYRIAVASPDTNLASQGSIRLRVAPGALPDTNGPSTRIISPIAGYVSTNEQVTFTGVSTEPAGLQSGVSKVYLQVNTAAPVLAGTNNSWSKTLTLPPGTNTISAYSLDFVGNFGATNIISVVFMNPTNDYFTNAIALTGTAGTVYAINGRATKDPGEPNHVGNDGGHSIWYQFRAPIGGVLSLSTSNSTFDTLLAVYTGDSVSNLVLIASNDDAYKASGFSALQCYVTSNVVYKIVIDGYGGASGNIALQYNFVVQAPPSFYTLSVTASQGGTVNPSFVYLPIGTNVSISASALPNYVFTRWEGDVTSTNNPVSVTMSGDKTLVARFRYLKYTEDFESGGFNSQLAWSFAGNRPWFVQSKVAEGQFAARSGAIGDSQTSRMTLVGSSIAGQASFDLRVSSESPYDVLKFFLNGVMLKQWSGTNADWTTFYFDVAAGTNTLSWSYEKDETFSEGLDAAFVDNIALPIPQTSNVPPTISASVTGNSLQIQLVGQMNQTYLIQASTNLIDWTTIATQQSSANGQLNYVDPNISQFSSRFYRVITP